MPPTSRELELAKEEAGLTDLRAVTYEQFAGMLKRAGENKLSLDHLKLLVEALPQFVTLQRDTIDGLKKVAEGAGSSQRAAFDTVGRSLDSASRALEALARNAQSDETRLEIAKLAVEVGKQGIEVGGIVERMNRDNNAFWWKLAGSAALVVVGVTITVFTGGRVRAV